MIQQELDQRIRQNIVATEEWAEKLAGCYRFNESPTVREESLALPTHIELKLESYTALGWHRFQFYATDIPRALPRATAGPIWKPMTADSILIDLAPSHSDMRYDLVAELRGGTLVGEIRRLTYPPPYEGAVPRATPEALKSLRAERVSCLHSRGTGAA